MLVFILCLLFVFFFREAIALLVCGFIMALPFLLFALLVGAKACS